MKKAILLSLVLGIFAAASVQAGFFGEIKDKVAGATRSAGEKVFSPFIGGN